MANSKVLATKILELLSSRIEVKPEIIVSGNTSKISEKTEFSIIANESEQKFGDVCFIDGGDAEAVRASTFSAGMMRVATVIICGKERKKTVVAEDSYLAVSNNAGCSISFSEHKLSEDLHFEIEEFRMEDEQFFPKAAASLARRLAELEAAKRVMINKEASLVLLDGSLDARHPQERGLIEELARLSKTEGIPVVAVSKSSSASTSNGLPVTFALEKLSPDQPWFVKVADCVGETYLARLGDRQTCKGRVLRIDIISNDVAEVFRELVYLSSDPAFKGYPYGLVAADDSARITHAEIEALRSDIAMSAGKDWSMIEEAEHSVDGHSVLDKMRF